MNETIAPADRSKRALSLVLNKLAITTQVSIAVAMGVSETTINRIKNERMEETLLFLAHLGYKIVPVEYRCVNSAAYEFLTQTHNRVMQVAPELIWDIEE